MELRPLSAPTGAEVTVRVTISCSVCHKEETVELRGFATDEFGVRHGRLYRNILLVQPMSWCSCKPAFERIWASEKDAPYVFTSWDKLLDKLLKAL